MAITLKLVLLVVSVVLLVWSAFKGGLHFDAWDLAVVGLAVFVAAHLPFVR